MKSICALLVLLVVGCTDETTPGKSFVCYSVFQCGESRTDIEQVTTEPEQTEEEMINSCELQAQTECPSMVVEDVCNVECIEMQGPLPK